MTVSVKICGISSEEALEAAIEAGADYAGFVFFEKSPRHLSLPRAQTLARRAEGRIKTVALTVNAGDEAIFPILDGVSPDFLQLHGEERLERMREIRCFSTAGIIKAIKVSSPADVKAALDYETEADILLFDTASPYPGALPGGNGLTFDWQWLPKAGLMPDFMLSGGLNPANVLTALEMSGAAAVDVSSGVESSPGVKDPARIIDFIKAAKSFSRSSPAEPVAE